MLGGNGGQPFVNVGGIAYQGRAVMDQHVAARRTRIKGMSGNSQNIWSLNQRIAGGYLLPDFVAASTITVAWGNPDMIRFRLGEWRAIGSNPMDVSLRRRPLAAMLSANSVF